MKPHFILSTLLIISTLSSITAKAQINTPIAASDYFVQNTGKQQLQSNAFSREANKTESSENAANNATNGEGPVGFIKCTFDNSAFNFNEIVDVAYGANGKFKYISCVFGTIKFDSKTFGDPIPGIEKAGYYRIVPKKAN
jgi:hypothetical protein